MKAAIHKQYGPPEVVAVKELPNPVPKEKEILIKVHASTVNRTDSGFRSAEYFVTRFFSGLFKPNQQTLGNEFAGVIESVGAGVTLFSIGDKVFGYNDVTFGAHAEYMVMKEDGALDTMPRNATFEEAAAMTEGGHYALCDIRAANVKPGQNVLVYGATGAIGSAAVQIMKALDVRVTAVCGTPHLELVKSLGADVVIDYMTRDFTKTDERYDFIFDSVGKSSFGACKPILKQNGIYISTELGSHAENIYLALTTPIFSSKKLLFPLPTISKEDVKYLKALVESGNYRPLIDRRYSLDQIVEAYRYVETGQKVGNVILTIA
jgi:NADPH:quinone reductase-like Zn-dependent oxidoreductase